MAPSALSVKSEAGHIPLQYAFVNFFKGGLQYFGFLPKDGVKYNVNGHNMRGGLLQTHSPPVGDGKHSLQILASCHCSTFSDTHDCNL